MPPNTMFSAFVVSPDMRPSAGTEQPGLNFAVTIFTPAGSAGVIRIAATMLEPLRQTQQITLRVRWAAIAA
jgi:hypothetical protein